jgi:hypothetical protein
MPTLPRDPAPGWYTAVRDDGTWRRDMRPLRVILNCGHEHIGAYPVDMPKIKIGDEHPCWSSCDFVGRKIVPRRVVLVEMQELPPSG